MTVSTLALVGATGGAGTTRLTVEVGATLARAGRDVALLDAAFATQGLAAHVPGRIDPDLTTLLTDATDADLSSGLVAHPAELPGHLAICPARAPFERLARAKTVEAAERFEDLIATAADRFDHVVLDVAPVAANQAVAAVSAADRVGLVAPASPHGLDHLPAMRDRLRDVDAPPVDVLANEGIVGESTTVADADATIPASEATAVADCPAALDPDSEFAPAVAAAVQTVFDTSLDLEFADEGLFESYLDR